MSRHGEQLDDVIDRVAAAETFVPADGALARQVAQSVHTSRVSASAWPQLAAIAAVATIALIAVTMVRNQPVEPATATPPRVQPVPVVESTQVTKREAVPVTPTASVRAVRREAMPIIEDTGGVPQIEALAMPQPLTVAELPVESLTIGTVDLTPIELGNLPLAEIDHRDSPKE
jgi:hypothetical protein